MAGKVVAEGGSGSGATGAEVVEVVLVPRRVEFFSVLGVWGYRRCAQNGSIVDEIEPEWVDHADAVAVARKDPKNEGLKIVV